jgi:hypothetical protein
MRHGVQLGLCIVLLGGLASRVLGDISPPFRWPWENRPAKPEKPKPLPSFTTEPFTIEIVDASELPNDSMAIGQVGGQTVLQVTPNFYKSLRHIAMNDPASDTMLAEQAPSKTPSFRVAAFGLSLTLGLTFGGLWLRRSGNGARNIGLLLLCGLTAACTLGGMAAFATTPRGGKYQWAVERRLRVELLDQKEETITLRVSRAYIEKLLAATKPVPKATDKEGPALPPPPSAFPAPPN